MSNIISPVGHCDCNKDKDDNNIESRKVHSNGNCLRCKFRLLFGRLGRDRINSIKKKTEVGNENEKNFDTDIKKFNGQNYSYSGGE
eukprot:Pgem_evm1s8078